MRAIFVNFISAKYLKHEDFYSQRGLSVLGDIETVQFHESVLLLTKITEIKKDHSALVFIFLSEKIMTSSHHRDTRRHRCHKANGPYQRQPAPLSQPLNAFHPRERAGLFPLPANIEAILRSARRVGPDFGDRRTFLVRNDSAVEDLYRSGGGNMKQCSTCGLRVEDYATHLDDHFRENR